MKQEAIYEEEVRHKKKKPQNSKSQKRSDHKHEYEDVIVGGLLGWNWGKVCKICGRLDTNKSFGTSSYKEFLRDEYKEHHGISVKYFYTAEELKEKYPGTKIYVYTEENGYQCITE